jgi:hypothetical protein
MKFYLGTHHAGWLWGGKISYPLFVSRRRLQGYKYFWPATCQSWALDSGGFSELSLFGGWTISSIRYIKEVIQWSNRIGRLDWAAPQDWMCEPFMIAKTGLTIQQHQEYTVQNFVMLDSLWSDFSDERMPFIPVLQGWTIDDYQMCAKMYEWSGVDLKRYPTVGLGSICRRQSTPQIRDIVQSFQGIKLHGFGVKTEGIIRYGDYLTSADSMVWSRQGRDDRPLPGHSHQNCANCAEYATTWRHQLFTDIEKAKNWVPPEPGKPIEVEPGWELVPGFKTIVRKM